MPNGLVVYGGVTYYSDAFTLTVLHFNENINGIYVEYIDTFFALT